MTLSSPVVSYCHHLADAAILSISSLLPTEKDVMSPSAALDISVRMPSVRVLRLLAVAEVEPMAMFLRAMSSLRFGEESTALGWLTAPTLILVISSQGAASITASMNFCRGLSPVLWAMLSRAFSKALAQCCFLPENLPVRIRLLMKRSTTDSFDLPNQAFACLPPE